MKHCDNFFSIILHTGGSPTMIIFILTTPELFAVLSVVQHNRTSQKLKTLMNWMIEVDLVITCQFLKIKSI